VRTIGRQIPMLTLLLPSLRVFLLFFPIPDAERRDARESERYRVVAGVICAGRGGFPFLFPPSLSLEQVEQVFLVLCTAYSFSGAASFSLLPLLLFPHFTTKQKWEDGLTMRNRPMRFFFASRGGFLFLSTARILSFPPPAPSPSHGMQSCHKDVRRVEEEKIDRNRLRKTRSRFSVLIACGPEALFHFSFPLFALLESGWSKSSSGRRISVVVERDGKARMDQRTLFFSIGDPFFLFPPPPKTGE